VCIAVVLSFVDQIPDSLAVSPQRKAAFLHASERGLDAAGLEGIEPVLSLNSVRLLVQWNDSKTVTQSTKPVPLFALDSRASDSSPPNLL
jgi:hypothetical protein